MFLVIRNFPRFEGKICSFMIPVRVRAKCKSRRLRSPKPVRESKRPLCDFQTEIAPVDTYIRAKASHALTQRHIRLSTISVPTGNTALYHASTRSCDQNWRKTVQMESGSAGADALRL